MGNVMLFQMASNPGNFDTKKYYNNLGIYCSLYVQEIIVIGTEINQLQNYMYRLRIKGTDTLYSILGEKNGGLLAAILFGDKNGMDMEQKERFQKVGISHIFAISGLHISLICIAIYKLIRRLTGSFIGAGILGTMVLICYILLTGVSISAIRAGIMFVLKVLADIYGRVYDQRTSLAVAASLLLIDTNTYIFDGGFLLSVGALLGVIYSVPIWQMLLIRWGKLGILMTGSFGIQTLLLPVMFQNFYEVCLYSIVVNMIVILLMPILLGSGLMGLIVHGTITGLSNICFTICSALLVIVDKISEFTLSLPFSRVVIGQIWWPYIVVYYVLLLGCIYYGQILMKREAYLREMFGVDTQHLKEVKRNKIGEIESKLRGIQYLNKRRLTVGWLFLPICLMLPRPGMDIEMTVIDVGQGDSIHIQGPTGGNYLIDGGSTDISNVGKYRIEPFLLSKGIDTLDYVFISHGDTDHYNGVVEMLQRQEIGVRIKHIVFVEEKFLDEALCTVIQIALDNNTKVLTMAADMSLEEKDLIIKCIGPHTDYSGEIGNASSMVLDISYDELDILLTGDIEAGGEEDFIEKYSGKGEYEILKVAHHGSKNSTPYIFLELINPKVALISAGVDSRYGHPHAETIERIEEYAHDIYVTSTHGAITFGYDKSKKNITFETFLEKGDRF